MCSLVVSLRLGRAVVSVATSSVLLKDRGAALVLCCLSRYKILALHRIFDNRNESESEHAL